MGSYRIKSDTIIFDDKISLVLRLSYNNIN